MIRVPRRRLNQIGVVRLCVVLLLALSLAGCGAGAGGMPTMPTLSPAPVAVAAPSPTPTVAAAEPTASASTRTPPAAAHSPTAVTAAAGTPCRLEVARPPDDARVPASTVIRTYRVDGWAIALVQGRGDDRSGDYGWAHIRNKHLYGIWSGGGLVTTYPEIGICSESGVQDTIGRALRDGRRREEAGGRAVYTWPAPNTRYDVLVVVGADGTIITAYPARR